ncbi:MAG: hypothetical protein GX297_07550 [Treponema sp.]|jgi:hypothetical protein|nr:hypothetical protein [Treponema sp.]
MKGCVLRGKLLSLLKNIYPDGIEQTSVVGIYYQLTKVDDILTALEYLTDKKYIIKKENPHPFKNNTIVTYYKISPTGIDLCEGNIEKDPGIVLQIEG